MKVVVTGADGFLGWHLRLRLHALHRTGRRRRPRDNWASARRRSWRVRTPSCTSLASTEGTDDEVERGNVALARGPRGGGAGDGARPRVVYANSIQAGTTARTGAGRRRPRSVWPTGGGLGQAASSTSGCPTCSASTGARLQLVRGHLRARGVAGATPTSRTATGEPAPRAGRRAGAHRRARDGGGRGRAADQARRPRSKTCYDTARASSRAVRQRVTSRRWHDRPTSTSSTRCRAAMFPGALPDRARLRARRRPRAAWSRSCVRTAARARRSSRRRSRASPAASTSICVRSSASSWSGHGARSRCGGASPTRSSTFDVSGDAAGHRRHADDVGPQHHQHRRRTS